MKLPAAFLFVAFAGSLLAQPQAKTAAWSEDDRREVMTALETTRQDLVALVRPLSEKQFFHRVEATGWSANDIVEHLGLIEEGYVREFWWALSQPPMPASYREAAAGNDQKMRDYATSPTKTEARGTNLPLNRYASKEVCVRIFNNARDLSVEFFTKNAKEDLRGFFIFRKDSSGKREVRDLHQQALLMLAHTIRHTNQLRRLLADPRFPQETR
jgi:uncharacterized damage-inducible protein DinB